MRDTKASILLGDTNPKYSAGSSKKLCRWDSMASSTIYLEVYDSYTSVRTDHEILNYEQSRRPKGIVVGT